MYGFSWVILMTHLYITEFSSNCTNFLIPLTFSKQSVIFTALVFFSVALINTLATATSGREAIFQFTVLGYSPSWQQELEATGHIFFTAPIREESNERTCSRAQLTSFTLSQSRMPCLRNSVTTEGRSCHLLQLATMIMP